MEPLPAQPLARSFKPGGVGDRERTVASPATHPVRAGLCRNPRHFPPTRRGHPRARSTAPAPRCRRKSECRVRVNLRPPLATSPCSTVVVRLPAVVPACARTWSLLLGCTVVSPSAWNTMVGTVWAASLAVTSLEARRNVPAPPRRMAAKAEGRSRAAPQARPECTPTAAYRSG